MLKSSHQIITYYYLIQHQDTMTTLRELALSNTPLLQRYLLSNNPLEFITKEVTLPQDLHFLNLLLHTDNPKDDDLAKNLGLASNDRKQLKMAKLWRQARVAQTAQEKETILVKMKQLHPQIKFNFPKPSEAVSTVQGVNQVQKKEINNKLKTQETVQEVVLKAFEENVANFAKLSDYGLLNFPLDKMKAMDERNYGFLFNKQEVVRALDPEPVAELLAHMITKASQNKRSSEDEQFPQEFHQVLTAAQIQALKKKLPNLFKGHSFYHQSFRAKYQQKLKSYKPLSQLTFQQKQDKRTLCRQVVKQLSTLRQKSKDSIDTDHDFSAYYIQKVTEEILLIEESIVDCSLDQFMAYLGQLKSVSYDNLETQFRDRIKEKYGKNKLSNRARKPLDYLDSSSVGQTELINRVVTSLLRNDNPKTIDALSKFINRKHLLKEQAKIKLSKGLHSTITNLYELFTVEQINSIRQTKKLTFTSINQPAYTIKQSVSLSLTLKNVSTITVKIFAIDLEKQYLESGGEVDQQINLKFLIALKQRIEKLGSQDPFQQRTVTIKIPQLDTKLGLFIIQLQGQGITSRAIIRKGTIITKQKILPIGHKLTFYDQNGEHIPKLSLWRDDKKVEVDGSYVFPFGPQKREEFTVVWKGYAQKEFVNIIPENYALSVNYLYHAESFVVGHVAKIIVNLGLTLSSQSISPSRLQHLKATATITNNQLITSTLPFDQLIPNDNNSIVLQIPIKSYTKQIKINLQGQIERIDQTIQKLNNHKTITIDLEENNNNFIDTYLDKDIKGWYSLKTRGKNGQPIPNIHGSFSYEQFGADFSFSQQLTADNQGVFELGQMKQVKKLTVTVTKNSFSSVRSWKINDYSENITYGGPIFNNSHIVHLKESESYSLPLPCPLTTSDIIFYYQHPILGTITNTLSQLTLTPSMLSLSNLKEGKYTLILLRLDRRVDFTVIKGKNWIGNELIDQSNNIYKLRQEKGYLCLGDLTAKPVNQNYNCSIDLIKTGQHNQKNIRIQVFAKNYVDPVTADFYTCKGVHIPNQISKLSLKNSSYYSDKTLSDQTSYVLNRRKQDKTAGNNLEKPHMFLKRVEVRSTNTNKQILQKESQFQNKMTYQCSKMRSKCANISNELSYASSYSRQCDNMLYGGAMGRRAVTLNRGLNSHNNFLTHTGHTLSNLTTTNFSIPNSYSHLTVYLISGNSVIKREYSLPHPSNPFPTLSLTHSALQDASVDQGWTMSRQIHQLTSGKAREISRNCTWTTVSKSTVLQYSKTKGHKLPSYLSEWSTYPHQKKLQVYDKQFCHELNFFIYKNDRPFFKEVIQPFLKNRIRKTFMDLYLLDSPEVVEFASAHRLQKLNWFQRALLVQKLREKGMQQEAQSLAKAMELSLKGVKQSGEEFKRFFQTILNAKKNSPPPPPPPSAPGAAGFGGTALFGSAPPPQALNSFAMPQSAPSDEFAMIDEYEDEVGCQMYEDDCQEDVGFDEKRTKAMVSKAQKAYKPGFKQTQKTREYTDTTYSGITNLSAIPSLVPPSLFWAELARHYSSNQATRDFLSDKFWSFSTSRQFILGCSVLPASLNAAYQLTPTATNHQITPTSSFLIFSREVKSLPYHQSKSIVLNQRLYDPDNKYTYDDEGNQVQQEVQTLLTLKAYTLQTIITNISGSPLEVQLLIDIPEGSIPLKNHEQTQIINVNINGSNTLTFERQFYFPISGKYRVYPANTSKNQQIIAKGAPLPILTVTITAPPTKTQTLDNILKTGTNQQVYSFLTNKNIFDHNLFNPALILWKLTDKQFYNNCIAIFRQRNYFNTIIWSFGLLHNDYSTCLEFFQNSNRNTSGLGLKLGLKEMDLPIFQYYPYYSSRVHKFADEGKSTIRVRQFRQNYSQFLLSTIFQRTTSHPSVRLTLIYYLLLQDRITEARTLHQNTSNEVKQQFQLQNDYIDCFLDMFTGADSNYQLARQVSEKYRNYPVPAWRKLFLDVYEALTKSGEDLDTDQSEKTGQDLTFKASAVNNGDEIKVTRPGQTRIVINFYKVDLQLYFSEFPFKELTTLSSVTATKSLQFQGKAFEVHNITRKEHPQLGDSVVELYEYKLNCAPKKIDKFLWTNSSVKLKINQSEGTLKVFHEGKKCTTSYVKVYSRGSKGQLFYRDGYTDIASSFRYALQQKDIAEFSILVMTDHGGIIRRVKPPSAL